MASFKTRTFFTQSLSAIINQVESLHAMTTGMQCDLATLKKSLRSIQPEHDSDHEALLQKTVPIQTCCNRNRRPLWRKLQLSVDKPTTAYRVHYSGSRTTFANGSLQAASQRRTYEPCDGIFTESVVQHLDWGSRVSSPFISLFADNEHARNWAKNWQSNNAHRHSERHPEFCCIVTVDLGNIGVVYSAKQLVDAFGIQPRPRPEQHDGELLVLNRIPAHCVMGRHEDVLSPGGTPGRFRDEC